MTKPDLSVVIPVYNEQETLPELLRRLCLVLDRIEPNYEILFVDDGSSDRTIEILLEANHANPRIKVLRLSRNFGLSAAITAGLKHAQGRAVALMDGDLQDPPEQLEMLVTKWREGWHVVYARRVRRSEGRLKRLAISLFYRLICTPSNIETPSKAGNFSVMDRHVVDNLNAIPEHVRYLPGLRAWTGFRQTYVSVERGPRYKGAPKQSVVRLVLLALDGILAFSHAPLRLSSFLGFFFSTLSFVGIIIAVAMRLAGLVVMGWASTIVVVMFLGGIQLITIGIVGEYLARIYEEVKQRPTYIVQDAIGLQISGLHSKED